jgi:CubicO group peptidase (beta-lactamase class C family)
VPASKPITQLPMKKTIVTGTLLFAFLQIGLAQAGFDRAKLDSYFQALEVNNKFMGSVAVTKNGELIYAKSVGFADVEKGRKADRNSKYRIGSITKSFTAVLVLKAVEEQKLALDQTIGTWFPTIKNAQKITVKQLLSHRSGIHSFTDNADFLTWNTQPKTEAEMIDIIAKGGSDFAPGSKMKYSNSNYVLLTYILQKVFAKPYADLLQEYIIRPAGLTDTYLFGKIDPAKNECNSYVFADGWKIQSETDASIPLGAGAITSTPVDLTKFANALFGGKLVKPESLEQMKTIKDGYGYGLFQLPFYTNIGYGHPGGIDGFSSLYAYFPDEKIAYALTSNGTNYNNNDISIAVLSAVSGKPYDIPVFSIHSVPVGDLDQYTGIYASKQIVLKITVSKEKNMLIAQATGQPSFPLEAAGEDTFKFDQAGVVLEFNPQEKTMLLKQHGAQIAFTKE